MGQGGEVTREQLMEVQPSSTGQVSPSLCDVTDVSLLPRFLLMLTSAVVRTQVGLSVQQASVMSKRSWLVLASGIRQEVQMHLVVGQSS